MNSIKLVIIKFVIDKEMLVDNFPIFNFYKHNKGPGLSITKLKQPLNSSELSIGGDKGIFQGHSKVSSENILSKLSIIRFLVWTIHSGLLMMKLDASSP